MNSEDVCKSSIERMLKNSQTKVIAPVKLAANFDEPEDRQKILRIVYEEFRREYSSRIR